MSDATAVVQEKKVEPAAPAAPAEPVLSPDDLAFEKKFAKLATREAELHKAAAEVKAQRDKMKAMEDALALKDKDPIAFLQKVGVDPVALDAARTLQASPQDPSARITMLEKRLESEARAREESATRAAAEAEKLNVDRWRKEVQSEIAKSDKHDIVKIDDGAADMVMAYIRNHYNETQQILPYADALDKVEAQLEAPLREKVTKSKKVREWLAPVAEKTEPADKVSSSSSSQTRTLTSALTNTTAPSTGALSEAERVARATKILEAGWKR
jgi:hypothetical protein